MNDQSEHIRWSEILNRQFGLTLFIICFGVTLHALDELVVATMLPAMVKELGGLDLVSWTVGIYEVGTVIFSAMSGLVTVRYGVRFPMLCSSICFGLGCIISALAQSMELVLLGRLLQGFGGGGLLAVSFVASAVLFPERTLARVMGLLSVFWGAAGFLGPMLGSLFVELYSWRVGFWGFGVSAFLLTVPIFWKIEDRRMLATDTMPDSYPVKRLLALTLGIFLIAAASIKITSFAAPLFIAGGIFCIAMFLALDAREDKNRMLPLRPLNMMEPMGSAVTMILCLSAATVALPIYGVLILTSMHDTSVLVAGYVIACSAIGWSLTTFLVSGLPERLDRPLIYWGMYIAVVGVAGYVYAVPNGPVSLVALFAFVEGVGFGIAWAFIPRYVLHISEPAEIERNTAALPTAQSIGYAVGAAFVGIVANWSGVADGQSEGISYFSATIIFLACLPVYLFGLFAIRVFVR
ncbi:MAG: MFS transporter [Pseudomonadota bacterium]